MKLPISTIILTYNEEVNLESCLKSISDWVSEIFVVDSYSTDGTAQIAKRYGCKIVQHPFENQAQQFNWALDNLDIKNEWILRLDADERMTLGLWQEIAEVLPRVSEDVSGFYIKRRVYFMGRWIKHGGYYPTWLLRLFKKGKARSELRQMDEHPVILEGKAEKLKNDFIDDNKKSLEWWINKHNNYASREVEEIIKANRESQSANRKSISGQAGKKRWIKENIYYKLPIFCRAFWYFIWRYFFRLGFLDAKEGLIFHFLQGFWYRFLVDAKLYEYKKKSEK